MKVTIVVATFGDPSWEQLARQRALPSALQFGVPVIHVHGDTLAQARNAGLGKVRTEWVVHLDADDELDGGYLAALAQGEADVRVPAVWYLNTGQATTPYVPKVAGHGHACTADCLADGNWIVVGAAVRTEVARAAGGWVDWPCYEDWEFWVRCWKAGATFQTLPGGIYRAWVRNGSRNRAGRIEERNEVHRQIAELHDLNWPPRGEP